MKLIISIYLSIIGIIAYGGDGDTPQKQKVYSIVKQQKSIEWYQTQEKLWDEEVKLNPKNEDAWLNLYTATRMLRILRGGKTIQDQQKVVDRAKKAIPTSFEYNYIAYWNGNNDSRKIEHLLKAYEINPDRPETYDDFVSYYELNRNLDQLKAFCEKWYESNDMSPSLYFWAYNLLHSVDEEDAIIITNGDNDTYPLFVLQQAKSIKKDVAVLNIGLLGDDAYRNKRFKELGMPTMDKKMQDFSSYQEGGAAIIKHLQQFSERPLYVSVTLQPDYYAEYENNMYLVGLAYKWCENDFDNMAVLKKNYEKQFLTDYLLLSPYNDISETMMNHMNTTYLAPFITLHNHYKESGDKANLTRLTKLIDLVAQSSGRTEEVEKMLNFGKISGQSEVLEKSKDALRGMLKLNGKLYAGQTEVTNDQYNLFLTDLMKLGRHEDLKKAVPNQVNWSELVPEEIESLDESELYQHGYPNEGDHPVSNITHEAAQMYCDWLTDFYNSVEDKKKRYKKVRFYLPTESEWEMMAYSGESLGEHAYPWGGKEAESSNWKFDTIVNIKGCYLANVNTDVKKPESNSIEICQDFDGGVFTVPVSSYMPNSYGLYCVIGNVAEMTNENGIAKGGGWDTPVKNAKIKGRQTYSGSSPNVGFRVMMEVIEN